MGCVTLTSSLAQTMAATPDPEEALLIRTV
jgi:hypothetical protein